MIFMVLALTSLGDGSKETAKKLGPTSDEDAPAARKSAFNTSSRMRKQVLVSAGGLWRGAVLGYRPSSADTVCTHCQCL